MNGCTTQFEELLAYLEGSADASIEQRVRAHLESGCARCAADLAWLAHVGPLLREAVAMERASESRHLELAMNRARTLYDERYPRPAGRSVLARLIFDSRMMQAPAFARGGPGDTCQLLFSTDRHNVELWEERQDAKHWYVIGQVLPVDGGMAIPPREVSILPEAGDPIAAEAHFDEFHAPRLPEGRYRFRIRMEDGEIVIQDVQLGFG